MQLTRRRSAQAVVAAALACSVTMANTSDASAFTWPWSHKKKDEESSGIRLCTEYEINFIKTSQDPESETNESGGSANGAPSNDAEAWLKPGTKEYENAQKIFDFWTKEIGTSGAFAAGVLSNVKQESGGTFDPLVVQGFDYFPHARATTPKGGTSSDMGGGLYQFTPYTKYIQSPQFAKGGWTINDESRFVWESEFTSGSINSTMKAGAASYGVDIPFTRAYTVVPVPNKGQGVKARAILDPNALVTAKDPVAASKAFQVGYERPGQYHPERESDAVAVNKVFNKMNYRGNAEKLSQNIRETGLIVAGANALDTIAKMATGALDPNERKYDSHPLFESPCRLPDGTIITDLDAAKDYARRMCSAAGGSGSSSSSSGGASGGGDGDKHSGKGRLLNREHMKPDAIHLADDLLEKFPEIQYIGGWRASDPYPDHPSGNSIDVMMPDGAFKNSDLGHKVLDYAWNNMKKYRVTYTIYEQHYMDPYTENDMEDRGSPTQNHFDHVHITTNMYEEKGIADPGGAEKRSETKGKSNPGGGSSKKGSGSSSSSSGSSSSSSALGGIQCGSTSDGSDGDSSGDLGVKDTDVIIPVTGNISDLYGPRSTRNHSGVDIANKIGTPVYAAQSGTVINAGPATGYGMWLRIKAKDGTITEYGHQYKNLVKVGDKVKAGQHITDVGNNGEFTTGPHLHLTVYDPKGQRIDPGDWLNHNGANFPQQIGAHVEHGKNKKGKKSDDK